MERRLAAILAADLVGYGRHVGADEQGTLQRFSVLRRDTLEPLIAEHGGRVFKHLGDGLLVEFVSAINALACAVALQNAIAEQEMGQPETRRFSFRIGLHLGDVVVEDDDVQGDGVIVATRIEGQAEPGGICVSEDILRQSKGKLPVAFEDLGERKLKNIADPMRLYGVLGSATTPTYMHPPLPEKPSIAVMPFHNMSADPEQEYFSDGVTEDIITELSRFSSLFVIARNSTFSYKGKAVDLKRVARELGVQYVLEGSIRRSGKRLRINVQLIDSTGGANVWAERYDRELEDIFDLQEEITRSVVGAIAPQIEMAEMARVSSGKAARFSAYDLALKAQAQFYDACRMGRPDLCEQAIKIADEALKQDPRCTHALWLKAWAHVESRLYQWSLDPDRALRDAWAAVERFFEVDQSDPTGYTVRGAVQVGRGNFDAALADYRRAFALNPNDAQNLFAMAWCESLSGLTNDAREHVALGLRLSPRDNDIWLGNAYGALAQASFVEQDFKETRKWAELSIQMHSRAPTRRALMIACCMHDGDMEGVAKEVDFLNSFAPDYIPSVLRGNLKMFKLPEHNALFVESLREAVQSRC